MMVANDSESRFDFLNLPEETGDTKDLGCTFALDDGLSVSEIRSQLLRYSDWVDSIKFG